MFGMNVNFVVVLSSILVGIILSCCVFKSCFGLCGRKEGMVNLNPSSVEYKMMAGVHDKNWTAWADVYNKNAKNSEPNMVVNNNTSQQNFDEQMEKGQFLMSDNTNYAPECCPSPYSTSSGCACLSPNQLNVLNTRGGNRNDQAVI